MTTMNEERAGFEAWLGIKPSGAAHDLAAKAFKAGAAWQRAQSAGVPEGLSLDLRDIHGALAAAHSAFVYRGQSTSCEYALTRVAKALHEVAPAQPAAQDQGEVQRLRVHVCKLGRYGAAFDPASTHYAYTYTDQPDNLGAGKLGRAALGINPGGDVIDAGLSLLDRLSREGFGVFQIAASTGQEAAGHEQ